MIHSYNILPRRYILIIMVEMTEYLKMMMALSKVLLHVDVLAIRLRGLRNCPGTWFLVHMYISDIK